jgi:hypothetical protein
MTADQKGCEGAGIGRTRGQLAQREQGRARNPQPLANLAGSLGGPGRIRSAYRRSASCTSVRVRGSVQGSPPEITLHSRHALHRLVPCRVSVMTDASIPRMSFDLVAFSTMPGSNRVREGSSRPPSEPPRFAVHHGVSRNDGDVRLTARREKTKRFIIDARLRGGRHNLTAF